MQMFDRYVFVDWSARNKRAPEKPTKHTIWVGASRRGQGAPRTWYCRTRACAYAIVLEQLLAAVAERARVIVGFDFPYGYATGFGRALELQDTQWSGVWQELHKLVVDEETNHSNRFEVAAELNARLSGGPGPFWGCPQSQSRPTLQKRSPGFPFPTRSGQALHRLRECERRLAGTQEAWKLYGNGSVGSQAILGIARVQDLRNHPGLADVSIVWPFERGFEAPPERRPLVVHVEIWPSVISHIAKDIQARVPDEAQVIAMCRWAEDLDASGGLIRKMGPPSGLTSAQLSAVLTDEGWVLGAV